jgi:hypothetical protein
MKKSHDARKRNRLALTPDTIAHLTELATTELARVHGGLPPSRTDPGVCSTAFPCSGGC